ncbi:response regulator [Pseudomonas sp. GD03842]|uniref:response regulator n=1 Tax=unclassified Pseudomonas TaxID=196821 RepID=UPI000D39F101|nr:MULTISPECIES: response regulator [unclassified Pseudomonas]MDH0748841.1 response regulator [Pseudomonas sp. GD03842]RAU44072.1 response regulator [Pseudomonas sp. RIT 409]RAU54817.1 response regulator [Pseudomonas sp. RIT 412]
MHRNARLLIVDDNVATRYALRRRMERHGFTVADVGTGSEGLALIAADLPDALILDVNLPDMSGFDIVRLLRSVPRTALLPVVHVSAASIQSGDIVTGLEAGADAYLVHPVDPDVLLATIRTLLRVRDTESALRESEDRFREIFANVAAPIAVMGGDLSVHECNQAFARLLDDSPPGQPMTPLFRDGQALQLTGLREAINTGERWQGTLSLWVRGDLRETEWRVSPYRASGASLVFIEDVTEHHLREQSHQQALKTVNHQLALEVAERAKTEERLLQAQKMDAIGKLTGGIAHDFNNLLTGIITGLELIKKRTLDAQPQKLLTYAEAALSSAKSAASLTLRLLAFARQQPLDAQPCDVNARVRSLEDLLSRTIGERISLSLELTSRNAIAMVDTGQLESAILNLVINARDALPDGGTIRISTFETCMRGDLQLADGPYIALTVKDDGVGIDPLVIDKVFDPFYTTKPVGQGTGLGLSTIYGFARQSGGDVRLRSVLSQGTEVTLMLPAAEQQSVAEQPPAEPASAGTGEHILVVEDTDSVRMFVTEVLTDAGYRCSAAADVETALDILGRDPSVDLLLTDVGLPRMNGRELADAMRHQRPDVPVLFMTGYAENALNRQAFLGDRMDLITKPFQIPELLGKLKSVLNANSAEAG